MPRSTRAGLMLGSFREPRVLRPADVACSRCDAVMRPHLMRRLPPTMRMVYDARVQNVRHVSVPATGWLCPTCFRIAEAVDR